MGNREKEVRRMSRFLRFCALLSVLFFSTNLFAAGYTCPTTKNYTSCSAGYYRVKSGSYYTCTACPSGYTSAGGSTIYTEASEACYIQTTAGNYIATANSSTQTTCPATKYCPSTKVYYGSTGGIYDCPAVSTSNRDTYAQMSSWLTTSCPTATSSNTTITASLSSWKTGITSKANCLVNYVIKTPCGDHRKDSVPYNESLARYATVVSGTVKGDLYIVSLNAGYYLTDQYNSTYCNTTSRPKYYKNAKACTAGNYCPGYTSMPLCSDTSHTYGDPLGLYDCDTGTMTTSSNNYWTSAAGATARSSCYRTVTLNKNGGTGTVNGTTGTTAASKTCYYNTSCSFPSASGLSQTGYTFTGGWGTTRSCTASTTSFTITSTASSVTYYACKIPCYKITLNNTTNGGSGGTTTLYKKSGATAWYSDSSCSTAVTSITKPTKTNATYGGHYNTSAASGGTQIVTAAGVLSTTWTVTGATTLYAQYDCNANYRGAGTRIAGTCTASSYTITLNDNNGSGGSGSVIQVYGSKWTNSSGTTITSVTVPTRSGYVFNGYYTATSGGTQRITNTGALPANTTFTAAATLYAQWTQASCSIGTGVASATPTVSNNTVSCAVTCSTGYSKTGGTDTTATFTKVGSAGVATVSTICEPREFTITLNGNGATTNSSPTSLYTVYGMNVYLDSARSKAMTTSANPITIPSRSYTVTYNANGGSVSTSSATATYTFNGYYSAKDSGGTQYIGPAAVDTTNAYITSSGVTAAKTSTGSTWYARWSDGSVTLPTPTRVGCKFNGWSTSSSATSGTTGSYTPTSSVILYATWTCMSVSASAKSLTYNGTTTTNGTAQSCANVTVSAPTSGASITYSTSSGGTYSATAPTLTNAGSTTVYYKVDASGYSTYTGSYTCSMATKAMTVSASTKTLTYSGSAQSCANVSVSVPSSGASITYSTSSSGTYSSTAPTLTNAGSTTVYYKVTGSNFTTKTGSYTCTMNKASGTTTLNPSSSTLTYPTTTGTFTASCSGGATPTIALDSTTYATATISSGTVSTTWKAADGTTKITVTCPATTNYNASSAVHTLYTKKAANPITLSASSGSINYNSTGTFTVSGAQGTLSVSSASETIATASLSGTTVTMTGEQAGSTTITVMAAGNAYYYSGSKPYTVTVNKIASTTTLNPSSSTLTYPTTSGSFTATCSSGATPTIALDSTTYASATISSGTVSTTWKAADGTTKITVTCPATTNYNASSAVHTLYTKKAASTTTVSKSSMTITYPTTTGTFTASCNSGATPTVSSNATGVATVSISSGTATVTWKSTGSATVTVTCPATANYYASSNTVAVTCDITKYTITVSKNGGSGTLTVNGTTATGTTNVSFTCNHGSTFTLPAWASGSSSANNMTKSGSVFTGWNTTSPVTCNATKTITANWATATCTKGTGVETATPTVSSNKVTCDYSCLNGYGRTEGETRKPNIGYVAEDTVTGSAGVATVATVCYPACIQISLDTDGYGGTDGTQAIFKFPDSTTFYSDDTCSTVITSVTKPTKTNATYLGAYIHPECMLNDGCGITLGGDPDWDDYQLIDANGKISTNSVFANIGLNTTTSAYAWYDCNSTWEGSGNVITGACTRSTYKLAYNMNCPSGTTCSSAPGNTNCTYGSTCSFSSITSTSLYAGGYKLTGWATTATGTAATSGSNMTTTQGGTVTLYAIWSKCAAGTYHPAATGTAANSCSTCSAGYYCPQGAASQTACNTLGGKLYTNSAAGSDAATDCFIELASKVYLASASSTSTTTCTAGYYCPGGNFYYSSSATNQGRSSCTGATYSAAGAASCSNCPSGYTANTASNKTLASQCQISCAAGTRVAAANATCTSPAGAWFSSATTTNYGQVSLVNYCMAGYTSSSTSASGHDAKSDCTQTIAGGKYVPATTISARYVKVTTAGSTANTGSHVVEIQAFASADGTGTNLLSGKSGVSGSNMTAATDGSWARGNYASGTMVWDMGSTQSLGSLKFALYTDGRTYSDVTIAVSTDNSTWTTVMGPIDIKTQSVSTATGELVVLSAAPASCAAGTARASASLALGSTNSCTACSGRTKYSAAGASSCSDVGTGYFTTGCNSSGNNCTGQTQCSGATYCSSGVQYSCPTAETNWTQGTGTGWSAVTSCFETRAATNVSTYCSAGQLKKNATSTTAWGTASVSTAFQARAGSIVSGTGADTTCTQCSGAVFSAGGSATSCTACPAQTSGWTRATGTGWDSYTDCYQTKAATAVSSLCESGQLKQIGASATTWATATVSTTFKADPGAYVTGSGASTTCSTCTENYYCPGGTTTRQACSALTGVSVSGGSYTSAAGSDASTDCKYTAPSKEIDGCASVTTNTVTYSGSAWPATTYSVTADPGYYIASNGTASATCTICAKGNYCTGGTAAAQACPKGTYGSTTGLSTSACSGKCAGGRYGSATGQTASTCSGQCTAGYYCPEGSTSATQNACATNSSSPAGSDAISDCSCNAGYSGNAGTSGGTCTACAKGTYKSSAGNTTCTSAGSGYYVDTTAATSRKACSALDSTKTDGTYSSVSPYDANTTCRFKQEQQTVPTYCATKTSNTMVYSGSAWPANTYSVTAKSGAIISGNNTASATCSQCAAGKYSAGGTATSCGTCANWTYSSAGAASCTACLDVESGWTKASGTGWTSYSNCKETKTGDAISTYCSAGVLTKAQSSATAWGSATITTALQADAGSIVSGQTCTQCAAGKYSAGGTATSCGTCANWTYSSAGAASCTACPAVPDAVSGVAWTKATGTGWTSYSSCVVTQTPVNCDSGSVKRVASSASAWGNTTLVSQLKSKAGYYASATATSCTICPAGSYCAASATAATDCPGSMSSDAGSDVITDCKISCDAGYMLAAGASACSACTGGYYCASEATYNYNASAVQGRTGKVTAGYYSSGGGTSATGACLSGYSCGSCSTGTGANGRLLYSDAGATSCSECPAVTGTLADRVTSYYGWWSNNIHNKINGCCAMFSDSDDTATFRTLCYYNATDGTYGGTNSSCQAYAPTECAGGYYSVIAEATEWSAAGNYAGCKGVDCMKGKVCGLTDAGYYSPAGATTQTACATGSYTNATGKSACTACGAGKTTSGTGKTSCDATCANATGAHSWATPSWSANSVTNLCKVTACNANTYYTAKTATGYTNTCSSCGANSSTSAGNTSTTCACLAGYTVDGKVGGTATTTSAACQLISNIACAIGQYVPAKATACSDCTAGYYCPSTAKTYSYSTSIQGRTACSPGTYQPSTGKTSCVDASAGYYVGGSAATSQTACTGATYAANTGQASCTACPTATNDTANVSSYSYWNTGATGDHTIRAGCNATFKAKTLDDGSMTAYSCYVDSDADTYGVDGTSKTCWVNRSALKCNGGYYNTTFNNSSTATQYTANKTLTDLYANVCTNAGAGYWSANDALTRTACATGLTTIGYGTAANEADDCGRKLHAGNNVIYLRSSARTSPSLRVKIGDTTFFGALSTSLNGALKVNNGGTEYSVVNDWQ